MKKRNKIPPPPTHLSESAKQKWAEVVALLQERDRRRLPDAAGGPCDHYVSCHLVPLLIYLLGDLLLLLPILIRFPCVYAREIRLPLSISRIVCSFRFSAFFRVLPLPRIREGEQCPLAGCITRQDQVSVPPGSSPRRIAARLRMMSPSSCRGNARTGPRYGP